jgi:hypothetical protein
MKAEKPKNRELIAEEKVVAIVIFMAIIVAVGVVFGFAFYWIYGINHYCYETCYETNMKPFDERPYHFQLLDIQSEKCSYLKCRSYESGTIATACGLRLNDCIWNCPLVNSETGTLYCQQNVRLLP